MKVDKHKAAVTFHGEEGDHLTARYDNRGGPFREGADFQFYDGGTGDYVNVFLTNYELRELRNFLNRLLGD